MKPTLYFTLLVWAFVMWGPDLGSIELGRMPWHAAGTGTYSAPVGALIGGLLLLLLMVLLFIRIVRIGLRRLGKRQNIHARTEGGGTFASGQRDADLTRSKNSQYSLTQAHVIHGSGTELVFPDNKPPGPDLSLRMARLVENQLDNISSDPVQISPEKKPLRTSTVWLISAGAFGLAIVIVALLQIYFSPYHTCVRALKADGQRGAEINCAAALGSR